MRNNETCPFTGKICEPNCRAFMDDGSCVRLDMQMIQLKRLEEIKDAIYSVADIVISLKETD